MIRNTARLANLVERVCDEKFDPAALEALTVQFLVYPGEQMAVQLADALTAVTPIGHRGLAIRLDRFGERWAYGAVRFAMPGHLEGAGETALIRRLARLANRLEVVLMRSDRTGHLIAVQSFRNRLGILEVSVHAFRDLMRTKRPSRPLAGVLVERIALAATDLTKLVPRLAARLMASAGPNGGRVLRERVDETVPVALDNPYDPVLTPEGMRRRQDLLLDERIPQAAPDALVKLMGELRLDTGALITDEDAPPSFLGALTRNRHFRTAAEGLGAMLSQASRN